MGILAYVVLVAAIVAGYYIHSKMRRETVSTGQALGLLGAASLSVMIIVVLECVGAVLSLFGIKRDLAGDVWDKLL